MRKRPNVKTFKLSDQEWERYKHLTLQPYYQSEFSEVIRAALELMHAISEPTPMNEYRRVVDDVRRNDVPRLLALAHLAEVADQPDTGQDEPPANVVKVPKGRRRPAPRPAPSSNGKARPRKKKEAKP